MINEDRSMHNSKLIKLISIVHSSYMIDLMSQLYFTLSDIYGHYIDKNQHLMRFEQFVSFAYDYGIFPQLCSKAAMYRVFHTLVMMN